MQFETHVDRLDSKLPRLSYRWDAETDILTASCRASAKGRGLTGTIDLEGSDGAFVVLDVADGALRGVDVVNWPDEVPEVNGLAAPSGAQDGRVTFCTRRPQRGVAAVESEPHLGRHIQRLPNNCGRLDLRCPPTELDWYARYFASLGDAVHVREPAALRERMAEIGRRLLQQYGS